MSSLSLSLSAGSQPPVFRLPAWPTSSSVSHALPLSSCQSLQEPFCVFISCVFICLSCQAEYLAFSP